jgi:hypothetical protein
MGEKEAEGGHWHLRALACISAACPCISVARICICAACTCTWQCTRPASIQASSFSPRRAAPCVHPSTHPHTEHAHHLHLRGVDLHLSHLRLHFGSLRSRCHMALLLRLRLHC